MRQGELAAGWWDQWSRQWEGHVQRNCGRRAQSAFTGPKQSWARAGTGAGEWGGWATEVSRATSHVRPSKPWPSHLCAHFLSVSRGSEHRLPCSSEWIPLALRGVSCIGCYYCCNYHPHHLPRMSLRMRTPWAQARHFFYTSHWPCGHSSAEVSDGGHRNEHKLLSE